MAIQIQGISGITSEVETTHRSLRATIRPMDTGTRGSYQLGMFTGILPAGLAANSEIFQFRWTSPTLFCMVRSMQFSASVNLTFFAAGVPVQIEARAARNWSADGTGGTPIVFSTSNTNKKRTDFALSALSDTGVRQATTAALGAGTKTLDTNPFAYICAPGPTASPGLIVAPGSYLWTRAIPDEYPMLFEQNEGFVIRSVAVPGTGTWTAALTIEWAEIDPAVVTGW